jgi:hypothetical protein
MGWENIIQPCGCDNKSAKDANFLEPEEWMKVTYHNEQDFSQKGLTLFTPPALMIVLMEN